MACYRGRPLINWRHPRERYALLPRSEVAHSHFVEPHDSVSSSIYDSAVSTPRLTKSVIGVLEALLAATNDKPAWGLSICADADLGPGTVYPILERLRTNGWITSEEETEPHPGRPARRYYQLTDDGRVQAQAALEARCNRIPSRTEQ